jgi:hypothetical protein
MYLNLAPRAAAIFENARPSALPEAKQSPVMAGKRKR